MMVCSSRSNVKNGSGKLRLDHVAETFVRSAFEITPLLEWYLFQLLTYELGVLPQNANGAGLASPDDLNVHSHAHLDPDETVTSIPACLATTTVSSPRNLALSLAGPRAYLHA